MRLHSVDNGHEMVSFLLPIPCDERATLDLPELLTKSLLMKYVFSLFSMFITAIVGSQVTPVRASGQAASSPDGWVALALIMLSSWYLNMAG